MQKKIFFGGKLYFFKKNTPGTPGGPGGRDRTLAIKSRKKLENQLFLVKK